MTRIFHFGLGELLVDHMLFNGGTWSFDNDMILCDVNFKTTRRPYLLYEEYCKDLATSIGNVVISDAIVKTKKIATALKATSLSKYSVYGENFSMPLQTLIRVMEDNEDDLRYMISQFYDGPEIEMLLKESTMTNFCFPLISTKSQREKSEMLIFMSYLRHGYILVPHEDLNGLVNLNDNVTISTSLRIDPKGGYSYANSGMFKDCVHFDFKSFYPSLVRAFKLSYSNVSILTKRDLIRLKDKYPQVATKIRVMQYDDDENVQIVFLTNDFVSSNGVTASCGLFAMYNDLVTERSVSNEAWGKKLKQFANTSIGCLNVPDFKYSSQGLYTAITFLGRHLIKFVTHHIHKFATEPTNALVQKFFSCSTKDYVPRESVINVQLDGFWLKRDDSDPLLLLGNINKFCNMLCDNNCLECSISYETEFLLSVHCNQYYYKQNGYFVGQKMNARLNKLLLETEKDPCDSNYELVIKMSRE